MRKVDINGFRTQIAVIYDQNVLTEKEALEEARRELSAEIVRLKARENYP